ncbi:hypothetical protein [Paenibacillus larvae]|uniref:hypothetical protein n=1 Tax=Paenibacillus larvae TaxID=1464 RepID=UPI00288FD328|nr:hypothetical protein [Paenibacillus larvae]MDT2191342.1 hypothetical protein [Paenibacillus larvae]MDT2265322.1 hypothetical protein [Paenibacillus larvae]MDT2273675.1 hypothetical protein [Paenibacillus larvae]
MAKARTGRALRQLSVPRLFRLYASSYPPGKSEIEIRLRKYLGEDMTCYRDLNQDVIDRL